MLKISKAGAVCLLLGFPTGADAQPENGDFDLLIRGIKAASVSVTGEHDASGYAVAAQLKTTGLAALAKRLRFDGRANGRVQDGRFLPQDYIESADTGKRQSDAVLHYTDGVPQVVSASAATDPQASVVDPATMAGTVDPLTAFFVTLRAVDKDAACNLSLDLFDGRRASHLQVDAPVAAMDQVICKGAYQRLQGFTPREMAKQPRFDFTLIYGPTAAGQMHLVEIISETIYGKVLLKRR